MSENDRLDLALKILRIARGMSQKQLAATSGVRNNAISKYESGKATPKYDTLLRLTDGLGLTVTQLQVAKEFVADINRLAAIEGDGAEAAQDGIDRQGNGIALGHQIDQVSKDAGRVVERLSALMLELVARGQRSETPTDD
ncbi:MAG: helix-turn-helix transcriptional regulator [Acidobacteriota bacterium]